MKRWSVLQASDQDWEDFWKIQSGYGVNEAIVARIKWHDSECPVCSTRASSFDPLCAEGQAVTKQWSTVNNDVIREWERTH